MTLADNNLEREMADLKGLKSEDADLNVIPEENLQELESNYVLENYSNDETLCLPPNKHTPRGDVDLFEHMFEAWRNQETSADVKEKNQNDRVAYLEKNQANMEQKVKDMKKTNDLLQNAVDSLHSELNWIDKVEHDNRYIREKLNDAENRLQQKVEELKKTSETYQEKLEKEEIEHKTKLENMRKELQLKTEKQGAEMQSQLDNHKQEIKTLKQHLESAEKAKANELAALTLEYENKLAKVQRLKAISSHNQPQTSSHQEIFRKKLQHLKSEYESETRQLKEQVKFLQAQMSAQARRNTQAGKQSVSPVPAFAKSARKF